jgi:hypothetical protein
MLWIALHHAICSQVGWSLAGFDAVDELRNRTWLYRVPSESRLDGGFWVPPVRRRPTIRNCAARTLAPATPPA